MKTPPEKQGHLVDHGFMDARARLLDVAAFLDRMERAGEEDDYRVQALYKVLPALKERGAGRAKAILEGLSDPSSEPIAEAHTKGAAGAFSGEEV
jgi:hypothetical protein